MTQRAAAAITAHLLTAAGLAYGTWLALEAIADRIHPTRQKGWHWR